MTVAGSYEFDRRHLRSELRRLGELPRLWEGRGDDWSLARLLEEPPREILAELGARVLRLVLLADGASRLEARPRVGDDETLLIARGSWRIVDEKVLTELNWITGVELATARFVATEFEVLGSSLVLPVRTESGSKETTVRLTLVSDGSPGSGSAPRRR